MSFGVFRKFELLSGLLVGLAFGTFASSTAFAEPTPTELAVARRLFEDAVRFERESRWELAASKLNDALAVKDTPGLRFHLAHCEDKLGHLVEAMIHYDHARELIASGVKAPDVEELLEPARRNLELRLPTLLLVVPAEVPNVEVSLDGRRVARAVVGRAAPVDPGVHKILVTAPGYSEYTEEVSILEGERRRISVQLEPVQGTNPANNAPVGNDSGATRSTGHSRSGTSARTAVLVGETAVTLAALGVGVGFLLAKSSTADRVRRAQAVVGPGNNSACSQSADMGPTEACSQLADATSSYNTARKLSIVGLAGASVGAVATVLTYVLWPTAPVNPQVQASTGSASFSLSGRF